MTDTTVLIVEDDVHMLAMERLLIEKAGYKVEQAANGKAALALLETGGTTPDVIISDVEMPEMDGYALCAHLRGLEQYKETPFIFVSAKTSLEEKLKGYEVGGDEYITKPLQGEEVVMKVRNIIDNRIRHLALSQRVKDSQQAAMQAMSYTSNLGQVLQFINSTATVNEFAELANKLLETLSALGLTAVLQFNTPQGVTYYKRQGRPTPLEENVLEMGRNKGRFIDFKARTLINYPRFAMLVLNMPIEDPEKYGLMKDVLGNLCDAVATKLDLLVANSRVMTKDDVLKDVTEALQAIDRSYHDMQEANMQTMDELFQRMEDAMFGFGLTETQEDTVRGILMLAKKKIAEIHEDGAELYDEFAQVHQTLGKGLR